jgi:hypothetical protein
MRRIRTKIELRKIYTNNSITFSVEHVLHDRTGDPTKFFRFLEYRREDGFNMVVDIAEMHKKDLEKYIDTKTGMLVSI